MADLYAVMGNPIAHSKSPQIHAAFAEQTGEGLIYTAMLVPEDGFDDAVKQFFRREGKGLNITVPFKENAFRYADVHTERAQRAQAVNTLVMQDDGQILADNTDGVGLLTDMTRNHGLELSGKRMLVLGAGGAVRGVLQPLLEQQPSELVIANRTVAKAQALAADFADLGPVRGCGFADVAGEFDVIINGTSASLSGDVPPLSDDIVAGHSVCYDMMYAADATVFNQWAMTQGATIVLDGLGMLVEQAAEAFTLWRQVRPDTRPVIKQLRAALK
ncbi:shikimate dehydrogenase (NADP(+)) [Bacterioplanes sanyensis]|uniref:shikimate dehydrogenase n=1 Tax=Bacterioplanes sanyensis TaxID=1249553 RepID=UPI0016795A57|nr:shikimate dehydrogenase [Bacterioplanes sanyensis]GGY49663.1 shikimate dehydrogenase (NADP(+)) [Bacterioplanes sanyensis]